MILNNFYGLMKELDEIPFYPKNIISKVKGYKEKISQLPKNIAPYVKRYGLVVPFAAGVTLYFGGMVHTSMYYPIDKSGAWAMLAGALTSMTTTFVAVLKERLEK